MKNHFNLVDANQKFDKATLEDGTKVSNKLDDKFAVGQILYVITEAGEEVSAPEGDHITKSGIVFTVDAAGKITGMKYPDQEGEGSEGLAQDDEESMEVEEELTAFADEKEVIDVKMEDDKEIEIEMELEDIIKVIGEVVEEKMEEVKEDMKKKISMMDVKIEEIKEKMSSFAAEPAAEKTNANSDKFSKATPDYNEKRYNHMLTKLNN